MSLPEQPNFIIFMTDQQRTIQDFPQDWVTKFLPNYSKFLTDGASFPSNICNTSPCGPSRASIFSGMYPSATGIRDNFGTVTKEQMNFANILNDQGYEVHYMGKLHMNKDYTTFSQSWTLQDPVDAAATALSENGDLACEYGMYSWTSPDFGTNLVSGDNIYDGEAATLAGGIIGNYGMNDNRVLNGDLSVCPNPSTVQDVLAQLQSPEQTKPFCLVISLLNPHDVSLYPIGWDLVGYDSGEFTGPDFADFQLPASYNDTLVGKPSVQAAYINTSFNGKLLNVAGVEPYATNYLQFYAYLHTLSDAILGSVMGLLNEETLNSTCLIRMADHGELGLSHGGMQEKNYSMYNEMIRVPMIWMNPTIPAGPRTQLVSLIDLVPTLGTLAGADLSNYEALQGEDYSAALFDPNAVGQDALLFNYGTETIPDPNSNTHPHTAPETKASSDSSDMYELNTSIPPNLTPGQCPNNIYAMIQSESKFAVYYHMAPTGHVNWSTAQYELYNLIDDPYELTNLIPVLPAGETYSPEMIDLITANYEALTALMNSKKNMVMPVGWSDFAV